MAYQNSPEFIWKVIYWAVNNVTSPCRQSGAILSCYTAAPCTLPFTCGERLGVRDFILLQTRKPLAEAYGYNSIGSGPKYFPLWRFLLNESCSKSLQISKPAENCNLKKLKGYSEYDVVKEGTAGCTQTASAHFRLFHSNNNTILYSGHMWLAYVYNESSAMHQTEAELFQSHCNIHYPDMLQLDRLVKVRGTGKSWFQLL